VTGSSFDTVALSQGCIDFLTYCPRLNGWLAGGWIGFGWDDRDEPSLCVLNFGDHQDVGEPILCLFARPDVKKLGIGLVLFIPTTRHPVGTPFDLTLSRAETSFNLIVQSSKSFDETSAIAHCRNMTANAVRTAQWVALVRKLDHPIFTGADTYAAQRPVIMQVDAAYVCPPEGLLLFGWMIDPFRNVKSILLRCGGDSAPLDPQRWIRVPRPDVRDGFATSHSGLSVMCGYLAYATGVRIGNDAPYIEIETHSGETLFKILPPVRSSGIDAIKDMLNRIELRYGELVKGYDEVMGPAIDAMNQFRLAEGVSYTETNFGPHNPAPRCSIIVPLYGRIDFMEYQLAFFAKTLSLDHEIIYVLDDPAKLRATEALAASCFARFQRPFRLIRLAENVGYAPANNVGLSVADGDYVCFLNSDVFPKEEHWLDYMLETAVSQPEIGIVGALLLFEDDTIQHEGCIYESLPEFGGWMFSLHPNKGRLPDEGPVIRAAEAVTGACLVMRADLARELGGFDEGYVIGDFEDVDLCEKVKQAGKVCVVDRRATLYHLERQSQGDTSAMWRQNLTLFNAWRFQTRWIA
jgi:GT2 family glycosyltransferase